LHAPVHDTIHSQPLIWSDRRQRARGHACSVSVLAQKAGEAPDARLLLWQPGEILGVPLAMGSLACFEAVVFDTIDRGEEVVHFAQLASFCRGRAESACVDFDGTLQRSSPCSPPMTESNAARAAIGGVLQFVRG